MNQSIRLARRPEGLASPEDFNITEEPLAPLQEGQLRVRNRFISLDPAMRGWMSDVPSYVPPVGLGEVMRAYTAGVVESSRHPDFQEGDAVTGILGVQTHAVSDGRGLLKVDTQQAPLERWIGGLGMPGMTAYFGLLEIGKPKAGETLLVSAASGAVGSVVGQIGKILDLRVVGIAGGPQKCADACDLMGFDACVDYKAPDFRRQLSAACPKGIDIYFENVGGRIFDAVLPRMNRFGRIPVCGMISAYNAVTPPPGPKNLVCVLVSRLTLRGFIVFDFAARYPEAVQALGQWHSAGKLHLREDVREGGVAAFPEVLNELYHGGNHGKLVLRV